MRICRQAGEHISDVGNNETVQVSYLRGTHEGESELVGDKLWNYVSI